MTTLEVDGYVVNVVMLSMGSGIYEEVHKNKDDTYTVFLNPKYNDETLRAALDHAIGHIKRNDWDRDDVQQIEAEAHGLCVTTSPMNDLATKYADIIERLRRERKKIRKKLEKYERKYAGMTEYQIMQHNEKMLEISDR